MMTADRLLELARLGVSVIEYQHRAIYTGSQSALIAARLATAERFPERWMKSGRFKGYGASPAQRWKIRRRGRDLFDVYHWRSSPAACAAQSRVAFDTFMGRVLNSE